MNTASDTELMLEVRCGRVGALATLFERHHARLFRFCLRMTGDRQASEDLVQDTFMRMLKYKKTFRAEFSPWMFRIARNVCVDYLRLSARSPELHEALDFEDKTLPHAEDRAVEEERADLLRLALLRLPEKLREVLILSRYEFKTYEEIARTLGCSVGAAKVRAHRGLKQLRQVWIDLSQEV